jgi:sodium/potassium-transporting ATPase subunit alpha
LTAGFAKQVLHRDGPNSITPPKVTPEWLRFMQNMFGWFNILLWIGSVLCYVAYVVQITTAEEVPPDNVSPKQIICLQKNLVFLKII